MRCASWPSSRSSGSAWLVSSQRPFSNTTYDLLSKVFVAAVDLSTQRRLGGEIERLLFEETLIIYAYFHDTLFASQKKITGVDPAPTGQLLLWNAAET